MMHIPVTMTFIAFYAITISIMTAWIGLYRDKIGVLRGDGGNPVLNKRIRSHGNLIENAPAMALMLGVSEMLAVAPWVLWLAVASFVVGRVSHFILFDKKTRGISMSLTQFPAAFLGIWCLYSLYIA